MGYLGATPSAELIVANMAEQIRGISVRAKNLAQKAVNDATFFSRSTVSEWASTFALQVQAMCDRLLVTGTDGAPAWARNPSLVGVVADYVEQAAREQSADREELLLLSGTVRTVARAAGSAAGSVLREAASGAFKGGGAVGGAGTIGIVALVGLVAVAYVWRAFK